jgi:hypothetical protein
MTVYFYRLVTVFSAFLIFIWHSLNRWKKRHGVPAYSRTTASGSPKERLSSTDPAGLEASSTVGSVISTSWSSSAVFLLLFVTSQPYRRVAAFCFESLLVSHVAASVHGRSYDTASTSPTCVFFVYISTVRPNPQLLRCCPLVLFCTMGFAICKVSG